MKLTDDQIVAKLAEETIMFNGSFEAQGYWMSDSGSDFLIWGLYQKVLPIMIKSCRNLVHDIEEAPNSFEIMKYLMSTPISELIPNAATQFDWKEMDEVAFISDDLNEAVIVPTFSLNGRPMQMVTAFTSLYEVLNNYGYGRRLRTSTALLKNYHTLVSDILVTYTCTNSGLSAIAWRVGEDYSSDYDVRWYCGDDSSEYIIASTETVKNWLGDAMRLCDDLYAKCTIANLPFNFIVRTKLTSFNGRATNDRMMLPVSSAVVGHFHYDSDCSHTFNGFIAGRAYDWSLRYIDDSRKNQDGVLSTERVSSNDGYDLKGTPLEQLISSSTTILHEDNGLK